MSDLTQELQKQLLTARKAQDKPRTLLFGTVLAAVQNRELELKHPLSDEEVLEVIQKSIKTRRESVEQYRKGGRPDLADREATEVRLLEVFLPQQADDGEIRAAVRQAIAAGATDLGRVMGQVMPKFKGRAEGKEINRIAREELKVG